MSISYDIAVEGNILLVTAWGADESLEEVIEYSTAIIAACLAHNCRRILADERRLVYKLSTLDTYLLAEYLAAHVPTAGKAAVVCHPQQLPDAEFWEITSANRGLIVKVFTGLEEAKQWLKEAWEAR